MGVERIAMMKYGIGEIGQLYSGDMRFLEQFKLSEHSLPVASFLRARHSRYARP